MQSIRLLFYVVFRTEIRSRKKNYANFAVLYNAKARAKTAISFAFAQPGRYRYLYLGGRNLDLAARAKHTN